MFTPQNEPLNDTPWYPSEGFPAAQEDTFIKSYLSPALKAADLATKLTVYDHNWDQPSYPEVLLADVKTDPLIVGTAWHCYAGDPSAMTTVHDAYPNKDNYFTECSGTGDNNSGFAGNLSWNMEHLIIGAPNNWAKTVLFWNLALNGNAGPTNDGCTNCRGVVTINSNGSVTKNVEYYLLEHLTKFVKPGSVRIGSSTIQNVINTAYQNTDGSRTLVAFNQGSGNAKFAISDSGKFVTYTLPQGAAVTFHW
jgi:glucosylceramidase